MRTLSLPPGPALLALILVGTTACRPPAEGDPGDSGGSAAGDGGLELQAALQPTVLRATWDQAEAGAGRLSWTIDGQPGGATAWVEYPAGPQAAWVAGLPYGSTVVVTLEDEQGEVDSEQHSLPELPVASLAPEVVVDRPELRDPTRPWVLLSVSEAGSRIEGPWWTIVLDAEARVVWARESPAHRSTLQAQPTWSGQGLWIDHGSLWGIFDGGAASQVEGVTLDGTVHRLVDTPGLHHPFAPLPDGALAWGAFDEGDEQLRTVAAGGSAETLWRCSDWLAQVHAEGFCASNALRWDADRQRYVYSLYTADTVLEVDPATGQAERWFGQAEGSWGFEPADAGFWWQHGAHWTEAGTLLLSSRSGEGGAWTEVREYAPDEERQVLVEVFRWGEQDPVLADYMGEAWRLPGGGTVHNLGSSGVLREIAPDGELAWRLDWAPGQYLGRSTHLERLDDLLPSGS